MSDLSQTLAGTDTAVITHGAEPATDRPAAELEPVRSGTAITRGAKPMLGEPRPGGEPISGDAVFGRAQPNVPAILQQAETPYCIRCDYNLTGIESARCPECGWVIDWAAARLNVEQRRPGTPAHHAEGWRVVPAVLATVALMLFRPIQFARRLRYDESLWPAAGVALGACLLAAAPYAIMGGVSRDHVQWAAAYGCGIVACMLSNCLALATICRDRNRLLGWARRFRLLVLLSLYATCFVAVWPYIQPPLMSGQKVNFLFPIGEFDSFPDTVNDLQLLGRTAMFYWWSTILLIFVCVRNDRSWPKLLCLPLVCASGIVAFYAGYHAYEQLPWW